MSLSALSSRLVRWQVVKPPVDTDPAKLSRHTLSVSCFCVHKICQVVLLSGHLDSWDVGQGAMDDGGGAMISWEALSLIKDLGNIETYIYCIYTRCMVPHR